MERVAHGAVFGPVAAYHVDEPSALAMRDVAQAHLLLVLGYGLVDVLEHGNELADELVAPAIDNLSL